MTTSLRIDEDDTTMLPLEESSCCSRSAVEIASLSCSANPLGKCGGVDGWRYGDDEVEVAGVDDAVRSLELLFLRRLSMRGGDIKTMLSSLAIIV